MAEADDHSKRNEYVDRIVQSTARLKIVVAGPGTGKSTAFRAVLQHAPTGDRVALSFINNLVRDLERDLAGLADAKTCHAYCRRLLHRRVSDGLTTAFHYFPPLEQLIAEDAELLSRADSLPNLDFSEALQTLSESDGRVAFFLERASYYNAVGFDDSVYRVLKVFQGNPSAVPALAYLVVDEYQDFNLLEVSFLTYLEGRAPTLIAGDDDQAIYGSLRNAHATFIRDKHASGTHQRFELPYCSRCTRVLVEATNAFVRKAQAHGLLAGRIPKQFLPFSGKDTDSAAFPKIVSVRCKADTVKSPQIGAYIAHEIEAIPRIVRDEAQDAEKGFPLALVLGPGQYLRRINTVLKDLNLNLRYSERKDLTVDALDGFRALLRDDRSNLGWRILVGCFQHSQLGRALRRAQREATDLLAILPPDFVAEQAGILEVLRRGIEDSAAASAEEWDRLESRLGLQKDVILSRLKSEDSRDRGESDTDRNGSVILTSYSGAKGLSAAMVFVVGMEAGTLPHDNQSPTEEEANQFIVALTRARKQCHLIHAGQFMGQPKSPSAFITWLPAELLEQRIVDAATLQRWRQGSSESSTRQ